MGDLVHFNDFEHQSSSSLEIECIQVPYNHEPFMEQLLNAQRLSEKKGGALIELITVTGELIASVTIHSDLDAIDTALREQRMGKNLAKTSLVIVMANDHPIRAIKTKRPPLYIVPK